jgi:hypothetical protein
MQWWNEDHVVTNMAQYNKSRGWGVLNNNHTCRALQSDQDWFARAARRVQALRIR